jgi:ElaA protein
MITWELFRFDEMTTDALYEILALRQAVFIIEQHCPYQDADGRDRNSHHLLGKDPEGRLVAYLRIVGPGFRFPEPSIGRVIVRSDLRGRGLGKVLMEEGLRSCTQLYPDRPIRLSAQRHLQTFYEKLGFALVGDGNPYDEDGIPHVEMLFSLRP